MRNDLGIYRITISYGYQGNQRYGWKVTAYWTDSRWAEDGTVEGEISTRYFDTNLQDAINEILGIAEQAHIEVGSVKSFPMVTLKGPDRQTLPLEMVMLLDANWEGYAQDVIASYGWKLHPTEYTV